MALFLQFLAHRAYTITFFYPCVLYTALHVFTFFGIIVLVVSVLVVVQLGVVELKVISFFGVRLVSSLYNHA